MHALLIAATLSSSVEIFTSAWNHYVMKVEQYKKIKSTSV